MSRPRDAVVTPLMAADHAVRYAWIRDTFLLCAYTSLRLGDAQELS